MTKIEYIYLLILLLGFQWKASLPHGLALPILSQILCFSFACPICREHFKIFIAVLLKMKFHDFL